MSNIHGYESIGKEIAVLFGAGVNSKNWLLMFERVIAFAKYAASIPDERLLSNDNYIKAINFLSLSPKAQLHEQCKERGDWIDHRYYSSSEVERFDGLFNELREALICWQEEINCSMTKQKITQFDYLEEVQSLFKRTGSGRHIFDANIFQRLLAEDSVRHKPHVAPIDGDEVKSDAAIQKHRGLSGGDSENLRTIIGQLSTISAGVENLSSSYTQDDPKRIGTAGEKAQEDEILRRYRESKVKNLKGIVSQVLRSSEWQLPDGHHNDERGIKRCYNRCYQLLHPDRRRKERYDAPIYPSAVCEN